MLQRIITYNIQMPLTVLDHQDHIEIGGIKFLPFENLAGFMEIFSRKDYEFGGISNAVLVDVGANLADSTLYCAARENIDKVYAYEPFPATYKIAEANIELNQILASKIELFNYGWSDKNDIIEVAVCDDINCSAVNTIKPGFAEVTPRFRSKSVHVELKKSSEVLGQIIEKHPDQPIILKMDVEGAEYECFADIVNADLLDKISVILMEWHIEGHECITEILEANNFIWFNENLSVNTGLLRAYRK